MRTPPYQVGMRFVARTPSAAPLGLGLGRLGLLLLLLGGCGSGIILGLLLFGSSLALVTVRGGPEGQVVPQELHDQGAVAVALLGERVELCNRIIEGLLSEVACAVRGVEDLVVEDGEVQREAKADGVGGGEISLGDVGGILLMQISGCHGAKSSQPSKYLVGLVGSSSSNLALVPGSELSEVAVVVSLPVLGVSYVPSQGEGD